MGRMDELECYNYESNNPRYFRITQPFPKATFGVAT